MLENFGNKREGINEIDSASLHKYNENKVLLKSMVKTETMELGLGFSLCHNTRDRGKVIRRETETKDNALDHFLTVFLP